MRYLQISIASPPRRRWFGRWHRREDRAEDLFECEDSGPGCDASGYEAGSVECDLCDCSPRRTYALGLERVWKWRPAVAPKGPI